MQSATAAEIKKRYRELSLKYHPDRNPDAGDMFMRIAKAYETYVCSNRCPSHVTVCRLTDDVSRDNWVKYGNPDGPRSTQGTHALLP